MHARADRDVGPQLRRGVDGSGRVDKHRRDDVGRRPRQLLSLRLPSLLQIQSIGWDRRSGRLDLAPEVFGLVHEELLAVGKIRQDVLLETNHLRLRFLIVFTVKHKAALEVVAARVRKQTRPVSPPLHGALNGREDGLGAEKVDAAVDQVADMTLGLLHVVQHPPRMRVANDASEIRRCVMRHFGSQNHRLGVLLPEERKHLGERKRTADVGIEDKEPLGPALEDGIAEVVESAGGAEGFVLAEVLDAQLGKFSRG